MKTHAMNAMKQARSSLTHDYEESLLMLKATNDCAGDELGSPTHEILILSEEYVLQSSAK
jgi:hypothetical protein